MTYIVGNSYLVPCIKGRDPEHKEEKLRLKEDYLPIHLNYHKDKITKQDYHHYHIDSRFLNKYGLLRIEVKPEHKNNIFYRFFICVSEKEHHFTKLADILPVSCKKIKQGKCPHKGYDLEDSSFEENGIITCPLHGLKFNSKTKIRI